MHNQQKTFLFITLINFTNKYMKNNEFYELVKKRIWYDVGNAIIENATNGDFIKVFFENINKIHHSTIADVTMKIIDSNKNDNNLLLTNALEVIDLSDLDKSKNSQTRILISYALYLIKNNKLDNIEVQLFEFMKNKKLKRETHVLLSYLAFRLYEKMENWDNCVSFALKFIKDRKNIKSNFIVNTEIDINDVFIYAVVSNNFFDFTQLLNLEEAKSEKTNKELVNFLKNMINGNLARSNKFEIPKVIETKFNGIYNFIKEKVFLIEIVNVCHAHIQKREVSFKVLIESLNLKDINSLIYLLIKALGMELVCGWIDSENEMFYFDKLMTKELNESELEALKNTFVELRDKVRKTVEMLKL